MASDAKGMMSNLTRVQSTISGEQMTYQLYLIEYACPDALHLVFLPPFALRR